MDPEQGAVFYTLLQEETTQPKFVRDKGQCLSCHASSRTQGVPGHLVRSVYTSASGQPHFGSGTFTTDDRSPFEERWGGWYVTGKHGQMRHMGNVISKDRNRPEDLDRELGANVVQLDAFCNVEPYLHSTSDIVALMVLEHQTQMHNAIAAANYETRSAIHQSNQMNELLDRPEGFVSDSAKRRIASSADRVLRFLLFCDEFQLTDRVQGTTTFAEDFAARGRKDSRGRSLREFDLEKRLFKYPCSYLIHSRAFAGLPDPVRSEVLSRLTDILEGREESSDFDHLTPEMRRDILSILRDTLPEMKQYTIAKR